MREKCNFWILNRLMDKARLAQYTRDGDGDAFEEIFRAHHGPGYLSHPPNLVENKHVVQAFPFEGADEALAVGVGLGRLKWCL